MTTLLTGMAGFIGFHVAKNLADRGDNVVGLDNLNDYYDPALKKARLQALGFSCDQLIPGSLLQSSRYPNLRFVVGDITDIALLTGLFQAHAFTAVCHLAAQAGVRYSCENPAAYVQSNLVGFTNLLECLRQHQVTNLCFASSSSVYGLNQQQPFSPHHHTDHPVSLYAATKKSNEVLAHAYSHLYGIACTGLRFFTVYGPWGRPDMAPMLFAQSILAGKPITVYNNGDMWRDFTYVADVAKATVAILDNPATACSEWDAKSPTPARSSAPFRLANIGASSPIRLGDFIGFLEKYLGKKALINPAPIPPGDVQSTYADTQDLTAHIGIRPTVMLEEGIQEFVTWYTQYFSSLASKHL